MHEIYIFYFLRRVSKSGDDTECIVLVLICYYLTKKVKVNIWLDPRFVCFFASAC
jgi:hypothetical protein